MLDFRQGRPGLYLYGPHCFRGWSIWTKPLTMKGFIVWQAPPWIFDSVKVR
jgi:hypothetical protein